MKFLEYYKESKLCFDNKNDFYVKKIEDGLYVGISNEKYVSVISESIEKNKEKILQQTSQLIVKCNVHVSLSELGESSIKKVNILMCKSPDLKRIEIFLNLCSTFIKPKIKSDDLLEVFGILNDFFTNNTIPSNNEIQGLYAELYTMYYFKDFFNLVDHWQIKDKLKFDFSINDKTKLEVKSTSGTVRMHHFSHDQLAKELYDIYVISYKLQIDGHGLKLLDLINELYPLLLKYPQKLLRVEKIKLNLNEDQLDLIAYNEIYTKENMKIIKAEHIPSVMIPDINKDSLSGIEYNALLTDSNTYESEDNFVNKIKSIL